MKPKRTILCVDDNEQSLSHRKIVLETRGYRVASFKRGEDALERFLQGGVDLVIADMAMPGLDGPQLIARIKDNPLFAGNLISPVANLLFLYGAVNFAAGGRLADQAPEWLLPACGMTSAITLIQTAVRMHCAAVIYGWRFAMLAPLRMLQGNLVNFAATATALWEFFDARRRGKGLSWRKTMHIYPDTVPAFSTGALPYRQLAVNQVLAGASSSAAARESG